MRRSRGCRSSRGGRMLRRKDTNTERASRVFVGLPKYAWRFSLLSMGLSVGKGTATGLGDACSTLVYMVFSAARKVPNKVRQRPQAVK